MSDARLRELERQAAQGGPEAVERLAVFRQREERGRGEVPRAPRPKRRRRRSERLQPFCAGCGTSIGSKASTCWSCGVRRGSASGRSEAASLSGRVALRRYWRQHGVLTVVAVLGGVAYVAWSCLV